MVGFSWTKGDRVKYEIISDLCATDCPYNQKSVFGDTIKVGSIACGECSKYISIDEINETIGCKFDLMIKARVLLKELE